jgi:hypothetical protein
MGLEDMAMPKRVLVVLTVVVLLSIVGKIIWNQAFTDYVTVAEVRRLIEEQLPVGSNKSEVEAFVDSLRIAGVTTTNFGYRLNEKRFEDEGGMFDEKNRKWKYVAKGYLNARLENVGLRYFQPCYIDIRFYFDGNTRLLDWDTEEYFIGT